MTQSDSRESDEIGDLIRRLGRAAGRLGASPQQVEQIRRFFGWRVLRTHVDNYVLAKYRAHVEDDGHWPEDTTPEEYLESLRQTVLDAKSAIYLTDVSPDGTWSIYFVGRVRRAWRGPAGSACLVVIFNAEHHFLST